MEAIDEKVNSSIFHNPLMYRNGQCHKPQLQALRNKRIAFVPCDVTIEVVDVTHLMYECSYVDADTPRNYYHARKRLQKNRKERAKVPHW